MELAHTLFSLLIETHQLLRTIKKYRYRTYKRYHPATHPANVNSIWICIFLRILSI